MNEFIRMSSDAVAEETINTGGLRYKVGMIHDFALRINDKVDAVSGFLYGRKGKVAENVKEIECMNDELDAILKTLEDTENTLAAIQAGLD